MGTGACQTQKDLGLALYKTGQTAKAIVYFRRALKLSPGKEPVMNNLAWILVTSDDPGCAILSRQFDWLSNSPAVWPTTDTTHWTRWAPLTPRRSSMIWQYGPPSRRCSRRRSPSRQIRSYSISCGAACVYTGAANPVAKARCRDLRVEDIRISFIWIYVEFRDFGFGFIERWQLIALQECLRS